MSEASDALSPLELEEVWRRKVEAARVRYFGAVERVKVVFDESSRNDSTENGFALVLAHREENASRDEYLRVLQAFAELVMRRNAAESAPAEDCSSRSQKAG